MEEKQPLPVEEVESPIHEGIDDEAKASLFPLFPLADSSQQTSTSVPQWLSNSSFTTDISVINDAVASQLNKETTESPREEHDLDDEEDEILESSESDRESGGARGKKDTKKKKKRKKRRRDGLSEKGGLDDYGSRKSRVRTWADSETKTTKDYYFDSHGDRDNLAFGCIYRMDIARYKPYNSLKLSGLHIQSLHWRSQRDSLFERDGDVDALDVKLKSAGRYWSAKNMALERHKNFKRMRLVAPKMSAVMTQDEFIPLSDIETSYGAIDSSSVSKASTLEESWEDEMLRKTREFNKLTRERPHDEKVWLAFAEFQDRVAGMQRQKGARLQTLEKKISILEKAIELNPDNEDLLLCLLKAYQMRDSSDVLIGRWEKILLQHSGSYKLWREFLHVVQRNFSRFKVSEIRKMYAHAIEALSASCSKNFRQQVHQAADPSSLDPGIVQLELGLVDIFVSLCRFEWQTGYRELATALFQAEIEFSLFCPPLLLTEQSKQRLFEHFWNSEGKRVGEEGALGWSTWLEKEEETRQRVFKEEISQKDEESGWTGWSEPLPKAKESIDNVENEADNNLIPEDLEDEDGLKDVKQEDDTESLLKMLGIDVNAGDDSEVNETATWIKWSEEESSRDCGQWMPVHRKSDKTSLDSATQETEGDEQLLRIILYEDVNEYLFSLSTTEAQLSLVCQFIEFFGGKISQLICSNSPSWTETLLSLEDLPASILEKLKCIHDVLTKAQSNSTGFSFECLSGCSSRSADMMKFLRNALLLCLTIFPRNYVLEEAILIAEELYSMETNASSCTVTPCRALAKSLLKSDRQDVLLCGVYARREANYGNIDHARKVFDMALLSLEGLPVEQQSIAPLLYFWYAEAELAINPDDDHGPSYRAMHILSCLGSGTKYSPFKGQPSSLQLLRARQGFKEKTRTVRSLWVRGIIDDQSVALICSAALLEELTSGWDAGVDVLDQAFAMVLPERRSHSYQLEYLFNFYIRMLQRHQKQSSLSKVWESISQGLQIYPFSPELLKGIVEVGHFYTTSNKLRWMLDDFCNKKPSVLLWLFALSFEMCRGGSQHRIRGLFERALGNDRLCSSVVLWRSYIEYEMNIGHDPSAARRVFFRAIHACPWSKKLWLDGFLKLNPILTAKELSDLQEVMRDKELNLRTDIYEILLQES
ncbi:protein NRDE2-like protein isoform X1 [Senna tora]|uniref:Protein NRDE2-like protein isoform X1 n=1 Tax=Senna tora TaxID=362788 RepID=A0A834TJM2_9FABA|nr:protein NRDE2-like protein isoform X1 [Senna tora]